MKPSRSQVPEHLYSRYGISAQRSIWFWIGWLGFAASLMALFSFLAVQAGVGSEVRLVTWQTGESNVEVKWSAQSYQEINFDCVIRATDSDGFDVGFAVLKGIELTDTKPRAFVSKLNVRGDVFSVPTPACETDLSKLPTPHFRPGLLPPAQEPPLAAPWQ